jgi:hypothetical protein
MLTKITKIDYKVFCENWASSVCTWKERRQMRMRVKNNKVVSVSAWLYSVLTLIRQDGSERV